MILSSNSLWFNSKYYVSITWKRAVTCRLGWKFASSDDTIKVNGKIKKVKKAILSKIKINKDGTYYVSIEEYLQGYRYTLPGGGDTAEILSVTDDYVKLKNLDSRTMKPNSMKNKSLLKVLFLGIFF